MQTDLEWWLMETTDKIKESLNTKITAVQNLKNIDDVNRGVDPITLNQLDPKAFFYQDFGLEATAYDSFVLFKWGSEMDITAGGQGSERASLISTLYIPETFSSDSVEHARTLLRYRRALKASLNHAYTALSHQGFSLVSLPDGLFEISNRDMWALPIVAEWVFV